LKEINIQAVATTRAKQSNKSPQSILYNILGQLTLSAPAAALSILDGALFVEKVREGLLSDILQKILIRSRSDSNQHALKYPRSVGVISESRDVICARVIRTDVFVLRHYAGH